MPYVKPGTNVLNMDIVPALQQVEALRPGQYAAHPGIYKCTNCAYEVVSAGADLPQERAIGHTEFACSGPFRWQLVAHPIQKPAVPGI